MELQNDPIRTTFQRFKECRICSRFSIDLADLFYVLSLIRQDAPFAEFSGALGTEPGTRLMGNVVPELPA